MTFLKRVMGLCETAVRTVPRGGDLKRGFVSRHRPAVRRERRGQITGWKREASARSARTRRSVRSSRGRPRTRSGIEYGIVGKWNLDRLPRCFRKAYNLPLSPRLPTASCHFKRVSNSVGNVRNLNIVQSRYAAAHLSPSAFNPSGDLLLARLRLVDAVSLLFRTERGRKASPEKFRHRTTVLILL